MMSTQNIFSINMPDFKLPVSCQFTIGEISEHKNPNFRMCIIFLYSKACMLISVNICTCKMVVEAVFSKRVFRNIMLNSIQKFCCNGFSKFLLLYVILGPTSL